MSYTPEQAYLLAQLARTLPGRQRWDLMHATNVIKTIPQDWALPDIAYAVVATAADPNYEKPASLAWTDSEHWQRTVRNTETPEARAERLAAEAEQRAAELAAAAGPERSAPYRAAAALGIALARDRVARQRAADTAKAKDS